MQKHRFWALHNDTIFNVRQKKVVQMLLSDFKGNLTSSKWAKICKCSPDSALRDINGLIKQGILRKLDSGGRSTSYCLIET